MKNIKSVTNESKSIYLDVTCNDDKTVFYVHLYGAVDRQNMRFERGAAADLIAEYNALINRFGLVINETFDTSAFDELVTLANNGAASDPARDESKKTKHGYTLIDCKRSFLGARVALIDRNLRGDLVESFVVAWGYDPNTD